MRDDGMFGAGKLVYLCGKEQEEERQNFALAETFLVQRGYMVVNPMRLCEIAVSLTNEQAAKICYTLIDSADCVFMLKGWQTSQKSRFELCYAKSLGKSILYQSYFTPFRKEVTK